MRFFKIALSVILAGYSLAGFTEEYERPVTFQVSEVLESELLKSGSYVVADEVRNDGFMNIYSVESEFGSWEIPSTSLLRLRLGDEN